ncbi:MAG: hypothetical protein IKO55_06420 [Kiritimatiellae bacterium]|nr:hypothetical protein [Kiritimatiellia bacterium]
MSELKGYKCDMCGVIIYTGQRITGNKFAKIDGERTRYPYRFDLCDDCFNCIKAECERNQNKESGR